MAGVLIREAAVTRDHFLRQIAAISVTRTTDVSGDMVRIDGGRITVRMTYKQRPGEVAPLLVADFGFENMSDEEVRMFMEAFDRAGEGINNLQAAPKPPL